MISATNSNISFKSVVPVKVFIDGMETFDKKNIKSACRKLSNVLAGTTKRLDISDTFAKFDPDYKSYFARTGYPKITSGENPQPSDFFRCIDGGSQMYIFTGNEAFKLRELGKKIGSNKTECKHRNIQNSFDLHTAKRLYGSTIMNFLRSAKLRITEGFDNLTGIKYGRPVTLQINMSSNGKYGLSTFKMNIDNIEFSK